MSTLTEIVPALRNYPRIIVTGPQRTGTTIAAKILACELNYRFIPEEFVGVDSVEQLFELYRTEQQFVIQGPCFCPYVHLLPDAVVLMRRPLQEILRSQARIDWSEEVELARYFTTEGPVARVKYDAWDRFQKPRLRGRAFELDYHSLSGHALWVNEEHRKSFGSRQVRPTAADEAIVELEREVEQNPNRAESHHNLGNALRLRGREAAAAACFQKALRLRPDYAEAYYDLARTLVKLRRFDEAILCYRQVLRLKPNQADAHKHLGDLLLVRKGTAVDEAVACYRAALRVREDDAEAYAKLGWALLKMGLQNEAISALRRASQVRPDLAELHSSLLYALHFLPDYDPERLAQEHDGWNQRHAMPLVPHQPPHHNDPDPHRRLRIGYVSPYFRTHSVGRFLLPLLEAHDRRDVEISCYAAVTDPDELTRQLRGQTDRWHDIADMTDQNLADLIRDDRIDILIDLDGHVIGNRLLTFARKPAPVQVTCFACCATTGMRAIDYRLTNPFLDPVGQPQFYSEESVWLPETAWIYRPHMELPPAGPLPALGDGCLTFGCLNQFAKVTLPTLTVWRDLLNQVSGSRLILHARPGSHRDRVLKFFAERGVDPRRITFVGITPPAQYFERYNQIDIGLDPFPYGGGTTTCDALWMGVPVVSLAGKTVVGRSGVSILSNVGLPELVAPTPADYVRIAADLAADLPRLASLRAGLRERMLGSPLMDAPRFARNVEAAYRAMWQRWCSKAANGSQRPTNCLAGSK